MSDRRMRWVQVFARLKPGYTPETAEPSMQGLFLQIRKDEMTLPAAKDWTDYGRAAVHEGPAEAHRRARRATPTCATSSAPR